MNIFVQIRQALQNNLPFVAYRKPNHTFISAFIQENKTLYTSDNYTESGFVFAPFNEKEKAILIPSKKAKFIEEEISEDILPSLIKNKQEINSNTVSKKLHIKLVQKGINAIKNNEFKKVVLSRKERIKVSNIDIVLTYQKLIKSYTNAFVYLWFHPEVGLWLGATPETLVKIDGNHFETMALAGTQQYHSNEQVTWKSKESEEQQFVTEYIINKLAPCCTTIHVGDRETIKAGNLLHLKTKIKGTFNDKISVIIRALHPTPAICGLPETPSKSFILNNESYDRSFYTGFLGEINFPQNKTQLFVNLRCMQIKSEEAIIFVGGGVTKDSNAEKEWEETVAKSQTMKKVLD